MFTFCSVDKRNGFQNCSLQNICRSTARHQRSLTTVCVIVRSNAGTFAPRNFRSRERKFYTVELSLPGTFAPWNFRSLEISLPGPNNVVMAENINIFKNRLDKFWSSYDFVYLFRAQPLDTGSVK